MAAALGRTADHLSRQFHRERSLSLTTWIARERIALAKDMLGDLRYNIAEVGWACGFNEASYFIRIFNRHTGFTPKTYRQGIAQPTENNRRHKRAARPADGRLAGDTLGHFTPQAWRKPPEG